MWDAHDGMGWWMAFGMVFWLLVVIAFALIVSRAFQGSQAGTRDSSGPRETPVDVARRRFAAGEISEAEFDRIVAKLGP